MKSKPMFKILIIAIAAILTATISVCVATSLVPPDALYTEIGAKASYNDCTVLVDYAFGDSSTVFVLINVSRKHSESDFFASPDIISELFVDGNFGGGYQYWRLNGHDDSTQTYLLRINADVDGVNTQSAALRMNTDAEYLSPLFDKKFAVKANHKPFSRIVDTSGLYEYIRKITLYRGLIAIDMTPDADRDMLRDIAVVTPSGEVLKPIVTNLDRQAIFSDTVYFCFDKNTNLENIDKIIIADTELDASAVGKDDASVVNTNGSPLTPYAAYGVPDNAIISADADQTWHDVENTNTADVRDGDEYRYQSGIRYLTLRDDKNSQSDVAAYVMLAEYAFSSGNSRRSYVLNGEKKYIDAFSQIEVSLKKTPHTVIYRRQCGEFELMIGGEERMYISRPSVSLDKNSGLDEHVVTGYYIYGDADKDSFLGMGKLSLSEAFARTDDGDTVTESKLPVYNGVLPEVNSADNPSELIAGCYFANYRDQQASYGITVDGLRVVLKGQLRQKGHMLGMKCLFTVPYESRDKLVDVVFDLSLTANIN